MPSPSAQHRSKTDDVGNRTRHSLTLPENSSTVEEGYSTTYFDTFNAAPPDVKTADISVDRSSDDRSISEDSSHSSSHSSSGLTETETNSCNTVLTNARHGASSIALFKYLKEPWAVLCTTGSRKMSK